MTCLQLYTKETEDFPGNAAASSLIYRHLNGHEDNSTISLDPKVSLPLIPIMFYPIRHHVDALLSVPGACKRTLRMERLNGTDSRRKHTICLV